MAVGAAALVAAGAGELLRPGSAWWYAAGAPLAAAAWWLGTLTRDRREQAAALAAQREHDVLVEERLRIARELHDVLTHGMGLIAVQAGVANHIADARPEAAREALVSIEAASRDALADVRRLLGTLREDAGRTPPPALADLPAVVERAAAAGVEVELTVAGTVDLPAPVELAAYRIVQEAVTNVVKHAAPASCRATVEAVDGVLRVEVTNDGPGGGGTEPGGSRDRRDARAGGPLRGRVQRRSPRRRRLPRAGDPPVRAVVNDPIRVLVVDDQALLRGSFRALLDNEPGFVVVGEAATGAEAVDRGAGAATRRRADGRAHARDGRHRGDPADLRGDR